MELTDSIAAKHRFARFAAMAIFAINLGAKNAEEKNKMATVTVSTKEELETAVKNNADKIIITGDLAQKIISGRRKNL